MWYIILFRKDSNVRDIVDRGIPIYFILLEILGFSKFIETRTLICNSKGVKSLNRWKGPKYILGLWLTIILRCTKFDENRWHVSNVTRVIIIQNVGPWWGRYKKEWAHIFLEYGIYWPTQISDWEKYLGKPFNLQCFACYKRYNISKFWPFVGKVPEGVNRYLPSSH